VYVDGVLATGTRADRTRDDVGRAYPDYGSSHGFTATIAVGGGQHVVCAYAIDATDDPNALVGCRPFEMRTGDPFGALDVVRASGAGIVVEGWAIDPDARTPIAVHLYVDGRLVRGATADRARGDVRAVFPQYPADHGYDITLVLSEGPHVVCVYGINEGPGVNALLGCRSI